MADQPERSPGGALMLRHKDLGDRPWTPPARVDPERMAAIERHMSRYFGKADFVFHELVSDRVHIDVHVISPSPGHDRFTLFTTGMSDLPMNVPPGSEPARLAELILSLPASWPLDHSIGAVWPPQDGEASEAWYWPIRLLKYLARFPHDFDTWLGFGHTIPNGDPPQPLAAGTKLCAAMLLPPIGVPEEAQLVRLPDGDLVNLYVVHALHQEELSLKLDRGLDPLLDAFDRHEVSEVLDPKRRNAARRGLFGIFG